MLAVVFISTVLVAIANKATAEEQFTAALTAYLELRGTAAQGLRLNASDPAIASESATMLARRIVARRARAKSGDIFGPLAPVLHERIQSTITGPNGALVLKAIHDRIHQGETPSTVLKVNDTYPAALPRATMPGQLLTVLPALPSALEYRFLGTTLLLIDRDARLVVDTLPNALPNVR